MNYKEIRNITVDNSEFIIKQLYIILKYDVQNFDYILYEINNKITEINNCNVYDYDKKPSGRNYYNWFKLNNIDFTTNCDYTIKNSDENIIIIINNILYRLSMDLSSGKFRFIGDYL